MHKKLESDLISLAHSILQMKNKDNVFLLKQKSKEIYEKLSVLAFVEEYVNATPNLKETKAELLSKVEEAFKAKEDVVVEEIIEEEIIETPIIHQLNDEKDNSKEKLEEPIANKKEEKIEQPFDDLEGLIFGDTKPQKFKDDPKLVGERNSPTLEEELKDTIPVDIMANLFEPAKPKSLNDRLQNNIQIGLNDRITFVKNLFDGSQEDFNRVVSQLNTLKTEKEAKKFVNKMVKPDYNWQKHEELEARFMEIIERKFA